MRFFATVLSGLALTSSVLAQLSSGGAGASSAVDTGTTPGATDTPSTGGGTGALAINDFPSTGARAGEATTITYTAPNNQPVTIVLRKGDPNALDTIQTLTTTSVGGSFVWTPATSLEPGSDYALEIRQGTTVNYSAQFGITGGTGTPSSRSSATPSSTLSTETSSASSSASSSAPASSAGSTSGSPTSRSPSNTASRSATPSTSVPGAGAMKTASPIALFGVVAAMVAFN